MSATYSYTSDFQHQFLAETGVLLRRRYLWLSAILGTVLAALVVAKLIVVSQVTALPEAHSTALVRGLIVQSVMMTLVWTFFFLGKKRARTREAYLDLAFWLVIVIGLMQLVLRATAVTDALPFWVVVMGTHVLACLFLPWTPREAMRPIWPLLAVGAAMTLIFERDGNLTWTLVRIGASPLMAGPGLAVCWARHNRRLDDFKLRFLQSRYGELRRELVDARRIHEDLFPRPITAGPVRMGYVYEPMRHIGGDYLYARLCPTLTGQPALNVLLLDVTGHGIAAALTVNRLYGEVERLFAEQPDIRPGQVLKALNRYVHLTLASHSVYVTALCLRADPDSNSLAYASGGHPPAFLKAIDGTLEQLHSTAFVVGLCADADFDAGEATVRFHPGDTLIAYTDGALEALNENGRMIGVAGLERLLAGALPHRPGRPWTWAEAILEFVDGHRKGPAADDTLVVELTHQIGPERPATRQAEAARSVGATA